ncbi:MULTISPECIES: hypothetical protein [Streptomyces]|uniref:hypothetical protein n=1 Tax=Streptomyces TaxID=1883 RepID=UPI000B15C1DF|nr:MULTISPECIES: hypothetical protein [Streptomyces]MCG5120185.1 hypothetical protein [Streptomyces sp. T7(2022)]MDH6192143.1 hypothetical protein [Streptomyces sp. CZ24]WTC04851.1 hypothetical protein OG794_24955 [Streptomyces albidoflavus]
MKKKKITFGEGAGIALAVLVGLCVLGAVVGEEEKAPVAGPEAVASPSAEEEEPAEDAPGEAQEDKGAEKAVEEVGGQPQEEKEDGELPGMVGENLQFAQDHAQAAGFFLLDDQDASGLGRLQVMDRNWTVDGVLAGARSRYVSGGHEGDVLRGQGRRELLSLAGALPGTLAGTSVDALGVPPCG